MFSRPDFYVKLKTIKNEIDKVLKAREKTGSAVQMAQIERDLNTGILNIIPLREEDILMMNYRAWS